MIKKAMIAAVAALSISGALAATSADAAPWHGGGRGWHEGGRGDRDGWREGWRSGYRGYRGNWRAPAVFVGPSWGYYDGCGWRWSPRWGRYVQACW